MQSNHKVLIGLIQKIKSPLTQIRNRAVTTLYTKVSAKIITQFQLIKSTQLPGVLFNWINETTPINKQCLYKILTVLHRYTFSEEGLKLLSDYEGLQFLQEFRKFLLSNQTNVDEHVDIIKKIIKQLLPLQNDKNESKKQKRQDQEDQNQISKLNQQQIQDSQEEETEDKVQNKQKTNQKKQRVNQKQLKKQSKRQRNIITFYTLNDNLPRLIDQQLYALLIQLKHGKKQALLQTLHKIQQIVTYWGSRYFKYKQDLIKELVTIIQGRIFSQTSFRIISILIRQLLQIQEDIGVYDSVENSYANINNNEKKTIRSTKINQNNKKLHIQKVQLQIKFQVFQSNPFAFHLLQTIIVKNQASLLSFSMIEYLLLAVTKFKYSVSYLPKLLQKIYNNNQWLNQVFINKFYQEQFLAMINHSCSIQPNICSQVIPFLTKFFPQSSIQKLSRKIPNLSVQLQQEQMTQSFQILMKYTQKNNNTSKSEQFDFNLELHKLQTHIKNLQKGISGLPKKPDIITLYIDCTLMLAVSVAKQDPLMSFYPKIKSLLLRISQHQFLSCRIALFDHLLLTFNSSQKINYLAQGYLKSQIIRLVFTDEEFYQSLLISSLNQLQTIGSFLQITKLIQTTTKEQNHKYIKKYVSIFYILSYHNETQSKQLGPSISSAAKIILSRIQKKHQVVNMLFSLFHNSKEQRMRTYTNILGLSQNIDLLKNVIQNSTQVQRKQKKHLKYSISTIKSFMNVIMNSQVQNSIKSSALDQMIECVQRIDLSILQKDEQFLSQILKIHKFIQTYIKGYLQKSQKSSFQSQFFIPLIGVYSILQKRLRLQSSNNLNQSIKSLAPQLYLNILINLCGLISEKNVNSERFRNVIPQFMGLVYYHCFKTFSSDLILDKSGQKNNKNKQNSVKVHWIIEMYPHEGLIKFQIQKKDVSVKRVQQVGAPSSISQSQKPKSLLLQTFLKGYKLNIKSLKQLLDLYLKHISNSQNKISSSQTFQKMTSNIICPILQRQLSNAIHNINSSHNQISFLSFLMNSFASSLVNSFQTLQQIVPHIINQLIKPNIPVFVKNILINIVNVIGFRRTKQFQSILQEINVNQLYYLKLIKKMQKLSPEQLAKLVKIGLSNVQNINNFSSLCDLFQIMLKPQNIKTLVSTSTQYTQLLILNSSIKCVFNPQADSKLTNFALILLHQFINETISQARSISDVSLLNMGFQDTNNASRKTIQLVKLICSLSIGPNLISHVLNQFQTNNSDSNFNFQNLCFSIQVLKTLFQVSNFSVENQLAQSELSVKHQNKLLKLFLIKISEYLKSNTQLMTLKTAQSIFTSVFNFICSLMRTNVFNHAASQIDLLDLGILLVHQKVKVMIKSTKSNIQQINKNINTSSTFLLLGSIFDYIFLRIQVQASQNSHYLLSSTSLLQSFINLTTMLSSKNFELISENSTNIYQTELLQKIAKVIFTISLHQQDYFIFKLNQLSQEISFDFIQNLGKIVPQAKQNFIIMFMRLILIYEGQKQTQNNVSTKLKILNSFQTLEDSQQEDDSSIEEERQLYQQKPKNTYQNHWIYKNITFAVQKNYIKHCKSLIALSLPAKMFLIEKPGFLQYLKRVSHLIDNKIIFQSNTSKKKTQGKSVIPVSSSSVLLSNSRRTVISQNQSCIQADQAKNFTQDQKVHQIIEFMKVLTSLFTFNEQAFAVDKLDIFMKKFINHLNKFKQVLKRLFYNIDKLYGLSEILNSSLKGQFNQKFLKMVTALSESKLFSLPLSNHLTQTASPMLQQSISTILKGMTSQLNQLQYQKLKQALKLLTTLSNHQSVRSYVYKNKLIQQLNSKINKYEQKNRNDFINMNSLYDIVNFYLNLSKYKDSHPKILNDKKVLQVLINQVYMQRSDLLSQTILQLLSNLAAYKSNKPVFMQNREIHKTILGQLESEEIQYKCHLLTLLYNLMYRHAPAVKLYKRKDVVDMLNSINWDTLENWANVKQIYPAVMEVLQTESQIPDKN